LEKGIESMKRIIALAALPFIAAAAPLPSLTGCLPPDVRTVAIVMPGSVLAKPSFDRGVAMLRAAGYRVKVAPRLSFKAQAPVEDRVADLEEAWMNPEVDLVLCARGGQGTEDLLPKLDWAKLRTRRQRVLGFSNITWLLNAMLKEDAGHPFSGPTLASFLKADASALSWMAASLGGGALPDLKLRPLRPGACAGKPCGGHISMLFRALPLGWTPDTTGRIVFLECSVRHPPVVRKELEALVAGGFFTNCAGVVFGDITPGDEKGNHLTGEALKSGREEVLQIKKDFAAKVTCPVWDGYPYGHVPLNCAIDFFREVTISEDGVLHQKPTPRP
jgi:muramoyltetrapeptide carboxypeptidase